MLKFTETPRRHPSVKKEWSAGAIIVFVKRYTRLNGAQVWYKHPEDSKEDFLAPEILSKDMFATMTVASRLMMAIENHFQSKEPKIEDVMDVIRKMAIAFARTAEAKFDSSRPGLFLDTPKFVTKCEKLAAERLAERAQTNSQRGYAIS